MEKLKNILKSDTPTGEESTSATGRLSGQGSHFPSKEETSTNTGSTVTGTEPSTRGPADVSAVSGSSTAAATTTGPEQGGTSHVGTTPGVKDYTVSSADFPRTQSSTDGSGTAAIGQTGTYTSSQLPHGNPTSSIVDPNSSDPLTYKKPEAGTHNTEAGVGSGAAATAAGLAFAQSEERKRDLPGHENPYRAAELDPRVDGLSKASADEAATHPSAATSSTTTGGAAGLATAGAATAYSSGSKAHETAAAPSSLTSTANPTERSTEYTRSANTTGMDAAGTSGISATSGTHETGASVAPDGSATDNRQSVVGKVLGAVGLGGVAGSLGYGIASSQENSAVADTPEQPTTTTGLTSYTAPTQQGAPTSHHRKESIPTTAYPSGTFDSVRAINQPIGGAGSPVIHGDQDEQSHSGRNVAAGVAAGGTAAAGATALGAHQEHAGSTTAHHATTIGTDSTLPPVGANKTGPTSDTTTAGSYTGPPASVPGSSTAHTTTMPEQAGSTGTAAAAAKREDKDHTARDTAVGVGAVGAGAAAIGAAEVMDEKTKEKQQHQLDLLAAERKRLEEREKAEAATGELDEKTKAKQQHQLDLLAAERKRHEEHEKADHQEHEKDHTARDTAVGVGAVGAGAATVGAAEVMDEQTKAKQQHQLDLLAAERKRHEEHEKEHHKEHEKAHHQEHEKDHTARDTAVGVGAGAATVGAAEVMDEKTKAKQQHQLDLLAAERKRHEEHEKEHGGADTATTTTTTTTTTATTAGGVTAGAAAVGVDEVMDEKTKAKQQHQLDLLAAERKRHEEHEKEHHQEHEKHHTARDTAVGVGAGAATVGAAEVMDEQTKAKQQHQLDLLAAERKRHQEHEKAGAAAAATGGAGVAATEHEREKDKEREKKPSIFKRIFKRRKNSKGEDEEYSTDEEHPQHQNTPEAAAYGTAIVAGGGAATYAAERRKSSTSAQGASKYEQASGGIQKPSYNPLHKDKEESAIPGQTPSSANTFGSTAGLTEAVTGTPSYPEAYRETKGVGDNVHVPGTLTYDNKLDTTSATTGAGTAAATGAATTATHTGTTGSHPTEPITGLPYDASKDPEAARRISEHAHGEGIGTYDPRDTAVAGTGVSGTHEKATAPATLESTGVATSQPSGAVTGLPHGSATTGGATSNTTTSTGEYKPNLDFTLGEIKK